MDKKALKTAELAKRWGVSPSTLATWRMTGHGPRFFYANKENKSSPRYPLEEVLAYENDLKTHTDA